MIERDRAARFGRALTKRSASSACPAWRRSDRPGRSKYGSLAAKRACSRREASSSLRAHGHSFPPIPGLTRSETAHVRDTYGTCAPARRLVVLGGGPIGCELAQCFARFGANVTQVEMLPRLLIGKILNSPSCSPQRFRAEGIDVLVGHKAKRVIVEAGEKMLVVEHDGREVRIAVRRTALRGRSCREDRRLRAGGARRPAVGREDDRRRTSICRRAIPNIFACGDVAGPYQFTHTASHQAGTPP